MYVSAHSYDISMHLTNRQVVQAVRLIGPLSSWVAVTWCCIVNRVSCPGRQGRWNGMRDADGDVTIGFASVARIQSCGRTKTSHVLDADMWVFR